MLVWKQTGLKHRHLGAVGLWEKCLASLLQAESGLGKAVSY